MTDVNEKLDKIKGGHRQQHLTGARTEGQGGREEEEEGGVMEDSKSISGSSP